jgi:alpha-D-ribose 1-methylphosphonate 5-triphosphate synthase subunit PhnH
MQKRVVTVLNQTQPWFLTALSVLPGNSCAIRDLVRAARPFDAARRAILLTLTEFERLQAAGVPSTVGRRELALHLAAREERFTQASGEFLAQISAASAKLAARPEAGGPILGGVASG